MKNFTKNFLLKTLVLSLFLTQPLFSQTPTISSFTPTSGAVGSTVTITGTNFSTTAANNVVYFDGVKAAVTSASTTTLSVTLPSGTTSAAEVSILKDGLMCKSRRKFNVTFNQGTWTNFGVNDFTTTTIATGATSPVFSAPFNMIGTGDFDLDGDLDVVQVSQNTTVSVAQNTSTISTITFSSIITSLTASGNAQAVLVEDFNNDGKLDIVVGNGSSIDIFLNTNSTPGTMSFSARATLTIGNSTNLYEAIDINNDGRLDIVSGSGTTVNYMFNTTTAGASTPTFGSVNTRDWGAGNNVSFIAKGNFNNDANLDILVVQQNSKYSLLFGGASDLSASFSTNTNLTMQGGSTTPSRVTVSDFNNDGISDFAVWQGGTTMAYLINSGSGVFTSGTSTFASNSGVGCGPRAMDLNGDALPELLHSDYNSAASLWPHKNNTTSSVTFGSSGSSINGTGATTSWNFGDINGDGKVDILSMSFWSNGLYVSMNNIGPAPSTITVSGTLSAFSKCSGSVSNSQSFTVSGANMQAGISVAALAGFEYSLTSNGTYTPTLTVGASGTIVSTSVFVRMASSANNASYAAANIVLSSTNATSINVSASGTVNALPTITGSTFLHVGQNITLTGNGTPNASTPWASSNTSVATVNSSGVVTGVTAGTATITYMNSNGCAVTSSITVTPAPTVTASNFTAGATNVTYTFTYTLGQAASANVFYLYPMPTGYIIPNPSSFPMTHVTMSVNGTNIPSSTWGNVGNNWTSGVQISRATPTASSIVVVVSGVTNSSTAGSKTFNWTNTNGQGVVIESFSASLTLTPANQWTGATNNNWTTASNWSLNSVPNAQSVISISSTSNLPEISTSVVVSDLTLSSSLVIRPSGVLRVNGNITNNGQIIFKSDATGSGAFDAFSGTITGTGTVQVERYIPAKRAFRFLSPSVTTTTSIRANWQNNGTNTAGLGTHITGSGGATNGFDATSTDNPSLFTFANGSWSAVTNTNVNVLTAGTPYRLMVRGDRTTDLTSNTSTASVTTLKATGALKTGNFTPTLNQSADGFSLIGNPYQAPIDIKAILTASTNMSSNVVYYWDPTLNARGGYVTRNLTTDVNDVVTSSFNQYVQPGQAVFVKKDNTANVPTMTITEANKSVANAAAGVFRNTNTSTDFGLLRVNLQANNQTIEGALALFNDNYTWNVTSEDATKMSNLDEEVSFVQNNTNLAIALQSNPSTTSELPIKIDKMRHTNYQWQFELNNYDGATPYLFDTLNNSYTQINNGTVVPFTADLNTTNRFKIVFQNALLGTASFQNELAIYPNPAKSGASFYVDGITQATVTVYNLLGQTIPVQTKSQGNTLQVTPNTNLSQGVYLVNITTQGNTQQVKWIVE